MLHCGCLLRFLRQRARCVRSVLSSCLHKAVWSKTSIYLFFLTEIIASFVSYRKLIARRQKHSPVTSISVPDPRSRFVDVTQRSPLRDIQKTAASGLVICSCNLNQSLFSIRKKSIKARVLSNRGRVGEKTSGVPATPFYFQFAKNASELYNGPWQNRKFKFLS